jgi:DNA-binding NtrC family response regulator
MSAKALLVMSSPRRGELLKLLEDSGLEVYIAGNLHEAERKLSGPTCYDLVCADAELGDGSWKDLLQVVLEHSHNSEMLVCSRCGDEQLWAEVIQSGAFDLIPEPYEEWEVARIVQSALDSQYMRRFARPAEARVY